jgi:hypothetical protein
VSTVVWIVFSSVETIDGRIELLINGIKTLAIDEIADPVSLISTLSGLISISDFAT